MKRKLNYLSKLVVLILMFATTVFSQNITNTLGASGVFTIKDATNNYLTLDQSTGQVNVLRNLQLENTTSSSLGVLFKGANRFLHNYGAENTFLGINSGNFSMTGVGYNTAMGGFSLNANTTGCYNSAFGYASLYSNSTGYENTAVGSSPLFSNTTGFNNTAVGSYSLYFNTTGGSNTALGSGSLQSNTTGTSNTAVGYQSLLSNTTSFNITAVGTFSLYSNTTGLGNTALGSRSLYYNTTGSLNTASGFQSLYSNTSGSHNTAVGFNSLNSNTTGYENTAVGFNSLYYNTTGNSNSALGFQSLYSNSTGSQNTSVGHHSLQNNNGDFNTALGYNAGSTITTGYNLTCIGIDAAPTSPTAINEITLGNIYVSSLRCNVTSITSLSDMRDKKNIKDLNLGIDFLMKLKPRIYNWDKREWYENNKSDGNKMKEEPTAGFIAQEFDEVQTSENAEWLNLVLKDNPEKWEATPGNLLPIMVKAIQDLKNENDELKTTNVALTVRLTKFEQLQNMLVAEIEKLKTNNEETTKVSLGEK